MSQNMFIALLVSKHTGIPERLSLAERLLSHLKMFFLFLVSALSFPLKGMWNLTFSKNGVYEKNFRLRIFMKNTTFVGHIRTKEHDKMIPKKVRVKELVPDERYVLILPYSKKPIFCEFWFSNETGILKSNVNSTDRSWNVTASVTPGEKMEIALQKYGKKDFYKYTLTPYENPFSVKIIAEYAVVIMAAVVGLVVLIVVRHKAGAKKKSD
jgi:hypothetical protein